MSEVPFWLFIEALYYVCIPDQHVHILHHFVIMNVFEDISSVLDL